MENTINSVEIKEKTPLKRSTKRTIFYVIMMALPILQFLIFYVYVNFSVILMAFKKYTEAENGLGYDTIFAGFQNFKAVFNVFKTGDNITMLWTSFAASGMSIFISMPLALFFSFYIYKKCFMSGFFKVILFLPQIVSTIVLSLIFKYIATDVYVSIFGAEAGLFATEKTAYPTLFIYTLWSGFGVNILLYSGAMSGINDSIVESAELDGVNSMQEFWYITFPMIFSTFVTFLVTSISHIFSNQLHLYTFFGENTSMKTVGYYLFVQSYLAGPTSWVNPASGTVYLSYPEISAFGLIITIVVFPTTLLIRHLLQKYGPRTD